MLYLISSPVSRQFDAMWEVEWALSECRIEKTRFRGLFLLETEEDALEKIGQYPTQAVFKVFPLHKMTKSNISAIEEATLEIAGEKIGPHESFAVRCRNRHSDLNSQEVEKRLGSVIIKNVGCFVDLKDPDKIVSVEIMGGRTGVSVLGKEDILKKEVIY